MHVHFQEHIFEIRLVGVRCHDVRWVVRTQDFSQVRHVLVADLALASASAHAKCCNRIAMDFNLVLETKILSDRLQTENREPG